MKAKLQSFLLPRQPEFQPSLSTPMSTYLSTLETVGMQTRGLVHQLEETFPPTNPNPEDTIEKIMFRSGQRSVVEWIINYMEDN